MLIDSKPIVRCPDDYERALERIAELGTPLAGSDEEAELFALIEAKEKWDARHDEDDWEWWRLSSGTLPRRSGYCRGARSPMAGCLPALHWIASPRMYWPQPIGGRAKFPAIPDQ
jgi:hypothetical protein